jgi:hypothetical protein
MNLQEVLRISIASHNFMAKVNSLQAIFKLKFHWKWILNNYITICIIIQQGALNWNCLKFKLHIFSCILLEFNLIYEKKEKKIKEILKMVNLKWPKPSWHRPNKDRPTTLMAWPGSLPMALTAWPHLAAGPWSRWPGLAAQAPVYKGSRR